MSLSSAVAFFTELLKEAKIPYVIIGGIAVGVFGKQRHTADADIVIEIDSKGVSALIAKLQESGLEIKNKDRVVQKLKSGQPAKIAWSKQHSVDLRVSSYAIDTSAINSCIAAKIKDGPWVNVAPPEEIIVYKLARFSAIDQFDIENIMAVLGSNLNIKAVRCLAADLADEADIPEILKRMSFVENLWKKTRKN